MDWQVRLRRWTAESRDGAPHVGVVPLLLVRQRRFGPGATGHSIVCGLLPREEDLVRCTADFRDLYERHREGGARTIYDAGIDYLKTYYRTPDAFDAGTLTTLLPKDLPVVDALAAHPDCALLFHVFDILDENGEDGVRCTQVNCRAEILESGPVYENVWWHNALFHGMVSDHVVVRFHHRGSLDTRFGILQSL